MLGNGFFIFRKMAVVKMSSADVAEAIRLSGEGLSMFKIAKILGFQHASVRYWLSKNGIDGRVRLGTKPIKRLTKEEEDSLLETYRTGKYSKDDIEKMFGVSQPTIKRILDTSGQKTMRRVVKNRKYFFDEHYFATIDTRAKAYILGFIFADGNMNKNMYVSSIGVADVDEDLIFFIQSELKLTGGIHRKVGKINKGSGNKEQDSIHLNMNSKVFCEHLIRNGVHPKKSLTLMPPTTVPEHLLNSFVLGYFDGDGCVSVAKNKQVGVTIVGTEEMMAFVQNLICNGSGVNPGKISVTSHKKKNKIYKIEWRGRVNCAKIGRYMYEGCQFSLKRKKVKFDAAISEGFESLSYKGMFGYEDNTSTTTNHSH